MPIQNLDTLLVLKQKKTLVSSFCIPLCCVCVFVLTLIFHVCVFPPFQFACGKCLTYAFIMFCYLSLLPIEPEEAAGAQFKATDTSCAEEEDEEEENVKIDNSTTVAV